MSSTVSGAKLVLRSEIVWPAALKDRTLAALEAGISKINLAIVASFGNDDKHSPTVPHRRKKIKISKSQLLILNEKAMINNNFLVLIFLDL